MNDLVPNHPAIITLVGLAAFALCAALFRRASPRGEQKAWAQGLVVAALIYVGFAVAGGGGGRWLLIEVGGLVAFSIAALVGSRRAPWLLAAGWGLHTLWDLALHHGVDFVPTWYPPVCLVFDLAAAAWIAWRSRAWAAAQH